jgi:hypothetical protein
MKKLFILFVLVSALGMGGYVFRSEIANQFAGQANAQLTKGVDLLLERTGVPPAAAEQVRTITKQMDAKVLLEFLADPKAFIAGTSEQAKQFMATPAGAKLGELLRDRMAQ